MSLTISAFIERWKGSAGNERANKDSFLRDLCEALDLPIPEPKDAFSSYCFEKDLKITHLDGMTSTGSIDLFRETCFVMEAKQGSTKAKPGSSPIRGTRAYDQYMEKAFGQAVNYAIRLPQRPPFVLTCDIGHSFHIWEGFSGTYGGYGARKSIPLEGLRDPDVQSLFRAIWLDPQSLNPARLRALVTRTVAKELGHLAAGLEKRFPAQSVADFLMRCVFTFFAEDVGLLPAKEFEEALDQWRKDPSDFVPGLSSMWEAMNRGGRWGKTKFLQFNGGLFVENEALDLDKQEIELLFQAARFDWGEVDPSIFGTLLESALSSDERHRLGAHYTPRAYIERIVRPTIEDPLRADWDLVQAEALSLLGAEPDDATRAKARAVLHAFHQKLANTIVLDPACGSGNFLYVAYDLLKRIEQEVLSRLADFGETLQALQLDQVTVTPAHFLGLEIKPWAAAIAELVLWIGHLQWWKKLNPTGSPHVPVLQRYENIKNRDAVLVWKSEKKTSRTRWDGVTFKKHPVTGEDVPDETAQVPIVELVQPREASWPKADFIVGNPPFIGNKRMREALGDGYAEALRAAYPEVPDSVDFVLYWWHKAANAVRAGRTRRFGLITTNSLTMIFNRRVIAHHIGADPALKLVWVIPDHPWIRIANGAAVRIAMTVGSMSGQAWLGRVVSEGTGGTPEEEVEAVKVAGGFVEEIHEDLRSGANVAGSTILKSNTGLSSQGVILSGSGFIVSAEQKVSWGNPKRVRPYFNGKDLSEKPRGVMVIDLFGLSEAQARAKAPILYQHVFERVKPERDQNNRKELKELWWLFAWTRPVFRAANEGLSRYIATVGTSKHRVFQFLDVSVLPDAKIIAISSQDAFHLGVLSSRVHVAWAVAAGGRMGMGNDPVYNHTRCFNTFPFPDASEIQIQRIHELGEHLDSHRKAAQTRGVTITSMYNILAKLRAKDAFTSQERAQHETAQTEILRQIHDELDAAVAEAYGWPADLPEAEILERLVALNRERAAEESRGVVRWLRPEFQAPQEIQDVSAPTLELETVPEVADLDLEPQPWPALIKDQLAALRSLLLSSDRLWTLESVTAAFKGRGRYREGIQAQLDLLADLRVLERLDTSQGPRWHRPQAMGA